LGVDGDTACSRLRVTGCPTVGILDHQVTVQGRVRGLGQGLHDRHTEGEVGDEVPVHDVDVQPVGVGGHSSRLIGQVREIGVQDTGRDLDCHDRKYSQVEGGRLSAPYCAA